MGERIQSLNLSGEGSTSHHQNAIDAMKGVYGIHPRRSEETRTVVNERHNEALLDKKDAKPKNRVYSLSSCIDSSNLGKSWERECRSVTCLEGKTSAMSVAYSNPIRYQIRIWSGKQAEPMGRALTDTKCSASDYQYTRCPLYAFPKPLQPGDTAGLCPPLDRCERM